jgi:hypothetical protein
MPHQEFAGPPSPTGRLTEEFAGPPAPTQRLAATDPKKSGLRRFAENLGVAGISLATGIPGIELKRRQLDNETLAIQNRASEQQSEQDLAAASQEAFVQQLTVTAQGDGPDAKAAMDQIFAMDPERGETLRKDLGIRTQAEFEEAAREAFTIQSLPFNQRRQAILERATRVEADGRNASDTLSLLNDDEQTQNAKLRAIQSAALSSKDRLGGGAGASKLGQSVVTTDPEGNLSFATPVLTGGEVTTQTTPIGGTIVSRSAGETSAQRQQRDIQTAGGQTTARAVSTRDQNFIDVGQRQADGTAIIRRGIQLLETIKTGTPESIALAATNLLGITGADETELNANLGKAVLSQLRTTFGAQFTQQEGERLATLEASFGKSTAGNRRLLEQTLRSMERDARRGIDAARRNTDQFSIDEIEQALAFNLDPGKVDSDDDRLKNLGF